MVGGCCTTVCVKGPCAENSPGGNAEGRGGCWEGKEEEDAVARAFTLWTRGEEEKSKGGREEESRREESCASTSTTLELLMEIG